MKNCSIFQVFQTFFAYDFENFFVSKTWKVFLSHKKNVCTVKRRGGNSELGFYIGEVMYYARKTIENKNRRAFLWGWYKNTFI